MEEKYYAIYNDDGSLLCIGTAPELIGDAAQYEIGKEEYNLLAERIERTSESTEKVFAGELAINDVDEDIREQVRKNTIIRFASQVYHKIITIDIVPEDLRDEVQQFVDKMIIENGEYTPEPTESELAVDEALAILRGEESE